MGETIPKEVNLVYFSSHRGRDILQRCISKGAAESYFPLTEQFLTQSSPPSCGPASLAMVLNSLKVDPGRVWRQPWRWFTEEMLASCVTPGADGVTMEHFALMTECNGATAQTFYAEKSHVEFFRATVKAVCATGKQRLVVCFDRAGLGQTGTGHYSPIAAYDEEADMVLILDVARFKYPPYWVSVTDLFEAKVTADPCTDKSRGFFVVSTTDEPLHNCGHAHVASPRVTGDTVKEILKTLLLDVGGSQSRAVASRFVHDVRMRLLNPETRDVLNKALEFLRGSALDSEIKKIIEGSVNFACEQECSTTRVCMQKLFMAAPGGCVSSLVSVGLDRPLDFFLRAMPQETSELAALLIIERGNDLLEPAAAQKLLHLLPRIGGTS